MRPLVEPPPSLRCMCGGELRLKLIDPADRTFGKQREIFLCTNCSRERTFLADRNPYVAPTACGFPSGLNRSQADGTLMQRGSINVTIHRFRYGCWKRDA
jgi:hypothetical protein